jgi:hypothetical protein
VSGGGMPTCIFAGFGGEVAPGEDIAQKTERTSSGTAFVVSPGLIGSERIRPAMETALDSTRSKSAFVARKNLRHPLGAFGLCPACGGSAN